MVQEVKRLPACTQFMGQGVRVTEALAPKTVAHQHGPSLSLRRPLLEHRLGARTFLGVLSDRSLSTSFC